MLGPVIEPFFVGPGGRKMSAEEIARERALAAKVLGKVDTSPVGHWTQGAARMVEALGGVVRNARANRAEQENSAFKADVARGLLGSQAFPAAPSAGAQPGPAPAAPASTSGSAPGNDVYSSFMDTIQQGGVTNPHALAAIAATGRAESGFAPGNVNRTWNDASQSGQPGTAGGIMSWRGPRYDALAASGDLSPAGQAKFFLQEDPQLIAALNNAQSVDEAMGLMNSAWKFAGYDQPGGEAAKRLAYAQEYLPSFQQPPAAPAGPAPDTASARVAQAHGGDWLRYANQSATRNKPISDRLQSAMSFLPELGVTMEVFSGGQDAKGKGDRRTGSVRHDHGDAADVFFYKDGRRLNWANPNDRPIFEQIVSRGRAAGVTGFGAGPGYMREGSMHLGFGTPAVWGAGGRGENAPDWLRNAYNSAPAASQPAGAALDRLATGSTVPTPDTQTLSPIPPQDVLSPSAEATVDSPQQANQHLIAARSPHLLQPQSLTGGDPMQMIPAARAAAPEVAAAISPQSGNPGIPMPPPEVMRQLIPQAQETSAGIPMPSPEVVRQLTANPVNADMPMAGGTSQQGSIGYNPMLAQHLTQAFSDPRSDDSMRQLGMFVARQEMERQEAARQQAMAQQQAAAELERRRQTAVQLGMDPNAALDPETWKRAVEDRYRRPDRTTIGGRLVDQGTGQVIADFGQEPTGGMQEYEAYANDERAAGRVPLGRLEYEQALRSSGATRINNNIDAGEKAWDTESAKLWAKRYDDLTAGAMNAQGMLGLYDLAESALNTDVRTGLGAEAELTLRQLGAAVGLDTDENKIAGGELIRSVQNRMALLMRSPDGGMGMPGALSDRDIKFLKDSQIGLDRSPEGNRRMLAAFRAMEQRKMEIARLADEYVEANGRLDTGFNRAVREYAAANPLFPETPTGDGAPQPGAVVDGYRFKGGDPADQRNWERR